MQDHSKLVGSKGAEGEGASLINEGSGEEGKELLDKMMNISNLISEVCSSPI